MRLTLKTSLIILALLVLSPTFIYAQSAEDLERANKIYKEVRCPVCTTQTVSESDTALSQNLKEKILNQITSGKTDAEVLEFLSSAYGDDILLMPRTEARTLPLWFAPWLVVILGGLGILLVHKNRQNKNARSQHESSSTETDNST